MAHFYRQPAPVPQIVDCLHSTAVKTVITDLSHDPPIFHFILVDGRTFNAGIEDVRQLHRSGMLPDVIVTFLVSMGVL